MLSSFIPHVWYHKKEIWSKLFAIICGKIGAICANYTTLRYQNRCSFSINCVYVCACVYIILKDSFMTRKQPLIVYQEIIIEINDGS